MVANDDLIFTYVIKMKSYTELKLKYLMNGPDKRYNSHYTKLRHGCFDPS